MTWYPDILIMQDMVHIILQDIVHSTYDVTCVLRTLYMSYKLYTKLDVNQAEISYPARKYFCFARNQYITKFIQ